MEIRADIEERVTVVTLVGEVGTGDLERVERALQALRRCGCRRFVLDLGEARALNAGSRGTLVGTLERAGFGPGNLKITGWTGGMEAGLAAPGNDVFFRDGGSVIEAVKSLVGSKGTKNGRPAQATV